MLPLLNSVHLNLTPQFFDSSYCVVIRQSPCYTDSNGYSRISNYQYELTTILESIQVAIVVCEKVNVPEKKTEILV